MHLLFLDESGQLSERRFFALGGVAIRDTDWHASATSGRRRSPRTTGRVDREVKWHGIRKGEVPPALADAVVAALARAPHPLLRDAARHRARHCATRRSSSRTDEDTYATGLMFLAERFQLLLEAADDVGMIVVDSRFREDDARLRRFFADLTKDGSPYSRLDRIVEGLFLGPSHYSIGLQCADLVCAITAAAERGNGQARGYLKTLLPASRRIRRPARSTASGSSGFRSRAPDHAKRRGCSEQTASFTW